MNKANILIVEDEVVIASDIQEMLEEIGHKVVGIAITAREALNVLQTKKVDLVLLDIFIKGEKDGIDLAEELQKNYPIPFIYLTSHSDPLTVEKAVQTNPTGYIVKPFEKADIYTAVELALSKEKTTEKNTENFDALTPQKDHLFVKDNFSYVKIKFNDLHWIKSTGNYVELHCSNKKYLIRSTIKEMIKLLPEDQFFQIHKSYIVNHSQIDSFNNSSVQIFNTELPIGRTYKDQLLKLLVE